jgi:beta-aspartyl-peptidase (threonine type)
MTKRLGKHFLGTVALLALSGGAEAATLAAQTCTRGTDVRVIEVVSPGEVGAACDLRYTREAGKNISVPFNASNSTSFCGQRARDLATSLASSGFTCTNAGAFDKIAAMREAVDLDAILAGGPSPSAAPSNDALVAEAAPAAETAPINAEPTPGSTAPIPVTVASADSALSVPPAPPVHAEPYTGPTTADGEPVSLTPQGAAPVTRARYSVGRVVGAAPEDPRPSTLAALEVPPADGQDEDRLAPPSAPAASTIPVATTGRPALDAAVATVKAQAAAWNDGDLAGFMNVFWNSPEFTFVSGSTVTKGWDQTYRRYRDGYGEGGDLGRLVYSDLEATMLAEETASVVGRYAFSRGQANGAGAMTLVLRRFEGAWRVVQHHMVADPAPATTVAAPAPVQAQ